MKLGFARRIDASKFRNNFRSSDFAKEARRETKTVKAIITRRNQYKFLSRETEIC